MISERCDYEKFSGELTQRLVELRVRELTEFDRRARGEIPHHHKNFTAATAARVAIRAGAEPMNMQNQLFKPAEITTAKLKMALMGFQGSGKTYTAASTAIGLVQMMKQMNLPEGKLPIAFADTEKGSDWILPRVRKAGIEMVTAKTRAFSDLIGLINEAENNASFLLVDSLTHFWTELCDTYCAKKAAEFRRPTYRLQFQDWAFLKQEWRKFTDRFVNSNLHIAVCGRAGFEYDYIEDDDTHKKQLEKTGIKFKAEGEMGYEPDLLVLMERKMNLATKADEHVAHVVKDRSTLLDGKEFADPTFESFLPHIKCLNLGGAQLGIDTSRTSAASIPADAPRDRGKMQRDIVLGEIQDLLVMHAPGQTVADKQRRITLLKSHFHCGWVEIEESLTLSDLRAGFDSLHQELEGVASRYGTAIKKDAAALDINDSLPDFASDSLPNAFAPLAAAVAAVTETIAPATDTFDESKWLAELTRVFGECVDFVSFADKQQTLLAPNRSKVTDGSWKKATKLATACMTRLMEKPGQASTMAAEA